MLSEKEKLNVLCQLGTELNMVQDLDILMERILSEARRFVNADAGSIYIKEGDVLHFSYCQNDTLQARLPRDDKLKYVTAIILIDETTIAGYVASHDCLVNLSDVNRIPEDMPYSHSDAFDRENDYTTRSMLTTALKNQKGDILGVLQIINAQDDEGRIKAFTQDDESSLLHFGSIAAVALERAKMVRTMLLRMIRMAQIHDPRETGAHVNRVAGYSVEIYECWARAHEIPESEIERIRDVLRIASMLHDVGKVGISDLILKKPGRFTAEEYEIMKKHTLLGGRLFLERQSEFDVAAYNVAMNHHEWWNGKGYPGHVHIDAVTPVEELKLGPGKKGHEIPLLGRIVALTDVFDALCSVRVYKEAWEESCVLETIRASRGTQFDPELVDIFFARLENIRAIQDRYAE